MRAQWLAQHQSFPLQLADYCNKAIKSSSMISFQIHRSLWCKEGRIRFCRPAGSIFSTDSVHTHFSRPDQVYARHDQAALLLRTYMANNSAQEASRIGPMCFTRAELTL